MCGLLDAGPDGRERLRDSIMDRYHGALLAYARRAIPSGSADPHEVVNQFLVSRLPRREYLLRWRESGLPFRRWLLNGLHLCAHEVRRMQVRASRTGPEVVALGDDEIPTDAAGQAGNAQKAFDRQFALELLSRCVAQVQLLLDARGRSHEWKWFARHHIDGVSYRELSPEVGVTPSVLNSAIRAVTRELRLAVRMELVMDGVEEGAIEGEVSAMLDALKP